MAEELENLLERIQRDGVDKAQAQADSIISEARKKAETIVQDAQNSAVAAGKKAQVDADAFMARGKKSLEQAARDVILSVGDSINATMRGIIRSDVSKALDKETLKKMLVKIVEAYCDSKSGQTGIELLVNPEDRKDITDLLMSEFAKKLGDGIEVKGDSDVVSGFRVSISGEDVQHDFSEDAITDSLSQLLRPDLAEIVRNAMPPSDDNKESSQSRRIDTE